MGSREGVLARLWRCFSWWGSRSGRGGVGTWGRLTQPRGSGSAQLPSRVGTEERTEPGCRDGSGQVKTTPTLRRCVNICPYPQAISIFVPSHTLTDSEAGSEGGQVRRSQPRGCRGFQRGRGASKPVVAIPSISLNVFLLAQSLSRFSVSAAGNLRQGWHFLPAFEVNILSGHHQNK